MPNWCSNTLFITGKEEEIKKFKKKAKTGKQTLTLAKFIPRPKILEKENHSEKMKEVLIKKYGADGWYHWNLTNYGTKWDIDCTDVTENKTELIYMFDSAWSPPIEGIQKISGLYPQLTFILKYDEPGMGFYGECLLEKGTLIYDDCHNN